MNYNKRVVVFTLVSTALLLFYSLFATVTDSNYLGLNNISILTEVFKDRKPGDPAARGKATESITTGNIKSDTQPVYPVIGSRSLGQYTRKKTITAFHVDTTACSLPRIMYKLVALKQGKKQKIRIAWLGDSMIEGDLLTQTFRKRIQEFFGGYGVGFVPATSVTAAYRTTVSQKWKGNWKEENFKSASLTAPLFLSGHTFYTADGELIFKDATSYDTTQELEKSLICGAGNGMITISVNGQSKQYHTDKLVNRLVMESSNNHTIDVNVQDGRLPVYGISIEPLSGVVVDNFSFRGITGLELNKLDTTFLKTLQTENPYDLVILEYGANLMFRPDDTDYTWFQKHIIPVVQKLQRAMPNAEFLIISTADRAFPYNTIWKTAVGIDNVVKMQAELAFDNNAAFYNMYASMGGAGTIVSWADTVPALANKDYIHPNQRGADILGNMLFDAFMSDYRKAAAGKQ